MSSLHDDLLEQANQLALIDTRKPRQANLRRAISSAYYAFFHFLIDQASKQIVGRGHAQRPYRQVLARAFQHGTMNEACRTFRGGNLPVALTRSLPAGFSISSPLSHIAHQFTVAQEKRHLADYDHSERFTRSDTLADISEIRQAIGTMTTIRNHPETHFFLLCLLTWNTLVKRR
jgi:hypothetical protein